MSKGLASVAALAMSAGVAFGQGAPSAAPSAFPAWGTPGTGPVQGMPTAMSTPGGMPGGAGGYIPQAAAGEMPHYGVVGGGATPYPGFNPTFGGESGGMEGGGGGGSSNPQVHRAAGGPDYVWMDIEWLSWKPRSMPIPFPLAITGPASSGGLLGQPGTSVLYGTDNVDYGSFINVFRLSGGFWCGEERKWGFEMSGFIQEARSDIADFSAPIGGRQVLARPLIDALTGQVSAVLVGFPGQFSGDMNINSRLKMGGAEANVVRSLCYCDMFKLNVLGGVRYIDHDETLSVTSRSSIPALDPSDPTLVDIFDEFACRNQFLGAQVGFEMEMRCDRFFCDVTGKVAAGNQHEQLSVRGVTNNRTLGVNTSTPGGMLALVGNMGNFTDNEFAYVPELTIKLGYQWTQRLSTFVGYNGLYISRLMRPGDQIDPVINPVFLPVSQQFGGDFGPVQPFNSFNKADFWVQGFTFGLSIKY